MRFRRGSSRSPSAITSHVAAKGVDAVAGQHLLCAKTSEEEAETVLTLLGSPERRKEIATAGRARVLSHHDWANSMQRLDDIIERCLAGSSALGTRARRSTAEEVAV